MSRRRLPSQPNRLLLKPTRNADALLYSVRIQRERPPRLDAALCAADRNCERFSTHVVPLEQPSRALPGPPGRLVAAGSRLLGKWHHVLSDRLLLARFQPPALAGAARRSAMPLCTEAAWPQLDASMFRTEDVGIRCQLRYSRRAVGTGPIFSPHDSRPTGPFSRTPGSHGERARHSLGGQRQRYADASPAGAGPRPGFTRDRLWSLVAMVGLLHDGIQHLEASGYRLPS